eukprot:5921077-Amphidinium_carterae.4
MGPRVCSYTATSSFQVHDEQSGNFLHRQREEAAVAEVDANRLQARVLACTLPRLTHIHQTPTPSRHSILLEVAEGPVKAMYGTLAAADDFQAEVGQRMVEV